MTNQDQLFSAALKLVHQGKKVAIATVVETWGSSPRPVGAQLVISDQDDLVGSVSGGCVEGAVLQEAQAVIKDQTCRVLTYGLGADDVFAAGLSCGGTIRIVVEPVCDGVGISLTLLEKLAELEKSRTAHIYEINLKSWQRTLISVGEFNKTQKEMVLQGLSKLENHSFKRVSTEPVKLYIVGAVHIAQHLYQMAQMIGIEAIVIDNRELFLNDQRFAQVQRSHEWPSDYLEHVPLDHRSAVVALTHDSKLDIPALSCALKSNCFYIGALGSRRTHEKRLDDLRALGFSDEELTRIHGPVGLDIGALAPAEIALSISAELVKTIRGPKDRDQ